MNTGTGEFKTVGLLRWPADDLDCHPVILRQVADVDVVMKHVPADRRGVCLQAGGNVGVFPLRLANEFRQVFTFEPDPQNFACLQHNIRLRADRIKAFRAALGESAGSCDIVGDRRNCGAFQIDPLGRACPMGRIDSLLPSLSVRSLDLLYLDIEGYEYFALVGGQKSIAEFRPVIALELKGLGRNFGVEDVEIIDWLRRMGYREVERIHRDVIFVHGG